MQPSFQLIHASHGVVFSLSRHQDTVLTFLINREGAFKGLPGVNSKRMATLKADILQHVADVRARFLDDDEDEDGGAAPSAPLRAPEPPFATALMKLFGGYAGTGVGGRSKS